MTPSHVEVNRCDGGCFHHSQSCLPSKVQKKKFPVSFQFYFMLQGWPKCGPCIKF